MVINALSSYSFYYFLILSEEGERLLVLQKMHQHVSTHDGNIFFLKDPSDLVAVSENELDLLSVLLGCLADLAAGASLSIVFEHAGHRGVRSRPSGCHFFTPRRRHRHGATDGAVRQCREPSAVVVTRLHSVPVADSRPTYRRISIS